MIILRQFLCYPCPIHPYNGSFSCLEHVITIGGRFHSFWGGFRSSTHDSFRYSGKFSGTIDMPYVLYMLLLPISMLSFTFIMRLAAAVFFLSDVPGQHRRAFVTNMKVPVPIVSINAFVWYLNQDSMTDFYVLPRFMKFPVPIVSINAFVWCLNQDSMTDFYVLPRFIAADRHHSSTAIIMVHHFAV
jgi:hypothetical protein